MFWPCWFGIGTHRVCVDLVPCVGSDNTQVGEGVDVGISVLPLQVPGYQGIRVRRVRPI